MITSIFPVSYYCGNVNLLVQSLVLSLYFDNIDNIDNIVSCRACLCFSVVSAVQKVVQMTVRIWRLQTATTPKIHRFENDIIFI